MEIAIDIGEMNGLRKRLREAAEGVGTAVPVLPGGGAFGAAIVAGAAASFESAMRREARALHDRWEALDAGVSGTLDDLADAEASIVDVVARMSEPLQ